MSDESRVMRELSEVFDDLETLLKNNDAGAELAARGVNVALALTAVAGLRSYVRGDKMAALEDLGTAVEEIAARASVKELPVPRISPAAGTGKRLERLFLLKEDGEGVSMGALWSEHPAVLVFLRHFGCVGCVVQIDDLRPRLGELLLLGFRVALVGCGTPAGLAALRRREDLDSRIELYTDPSLETYQTAGLKRSWMGAWGPLAVLGAAKAMGDGYQQPGSLLFGNKDEGERTQQGGLLLVDRGGVVLYAYASERLGDLPPLGEVVDVGLGLMARGASVLV